MRLAIISRSDLSKLGKSQFRIHYSVVRWCGGVGGEERYHLINHVCGWRVEREGELNNKHVV